MSLYINRESPLAKADDTLLSDFDRHHLSLLQNGTSTETCGAEVRCYLKKIEENVTKDTDIMKWWQVSFVLV